MKIRNIFAFSLLLLQFPVFSQLTEEQVLNRIKTSTEKELVEYNSQLLIEGFLYHADLVADKLVEIQPENSNYQYRKGFSTIMLSEDFQEALPHFEIAVKSINNKYDMFSTKEPSAPSDAFFYLARCYHQNENIDKAEEYFQTFLKNSHKKSELIPRAKLHLLQCAEARVQMKTPVKVFLNNVGETINSAYPEYSPVVSLDGSALYFTSRRPWKKKVSDKLKDPMMNLYMEDIYVSYQDFDQKWTKPVKLDFCKPDRNEATCAVSSDERKIYFYQDSTGGGDIYHTNFHSEKFTDIQILGIKDVNSEYWETHCMMSHDNQRIYFVSNRPKGFGGRDIYYCEHLGENQWSAPINMGPNVNSKYDEDSPFLSIDNKTMYYSTNGSKSIGGFDIMRTEMQEDGSWSEGKNLGYPFNSTSDDIFYTTTVDGLKGFLTSHRKHGFGEKDIYEIHNEFLGIQNVSVFKGYISSEDGKQVEDDLVVMVNVKCLDCATKLDRVIYPRPRDGFFITGLEPCKTYQIDFQNLTHNLSVVTDHFTTSCDSTYQEVTRNLVLNMARTAEIIQQIATQPVIDTLIETIAVVPVKAKTEEGIQQTTTLPVIDILKETIAIVPVKVKTEEGIQQTATLPAIDTLKETIAVVPVKVKTEEGFQQTTTLPAIDTLKETIAVVPVKVKTEEGFQQTTTLPAIDTLKETIAVVPVKVKTEEGIQQTTTLPAIDTLKETIAVVPVKVKTEEGIQQTATLPAIDTLKETIAVVPVKVKTEEGIQQTTTLPAIDTLKETIAVVPVKVKTYENFDFKQYLGFNKSKISLEEGELHDILEKINAQLNDGREQVTISIYSSASNVPTSTFKSNQLLAEKRAENILNSLTVYFEKTGKRKDRVSIVVVSASVQGPEYKGDSQNLQKYEPYQYVRLKTH